MTFDEILKSILRMNDLKAVQDGPILRVEKRTDMVARGETVQTRLFKLDYAKAQSLAETVRKVLSAEAGVSVDGRTNSIMITDDDEHLKEVGSAHTTGHDRSPHRRDDDQLRQGTGGPVGVYTTV